MSGLIVGLVLRTHNTREFDQGAKFVAVVYADHAWDDGTNAYPAVETVAGIIGCSARTVQRHVRALEKMGVLIAYGKGPRGQTKYRFPLETGADGYVRLAPAGKGDIMAPRQIVTPGGDTDSGDRDSGDTGVTRIINPSFKPKEEEEARAQTFSDELQHALVEAGIFKPCWADVAARLAGGWSERDIFALLAWMREAGGRPGRFVARLREGTRAPGRYYPLLPKSEDAPADADTPEDTVPPEQPEWWPALVRNALPDANRFVREEVSRAVVRWEGPDLLVAVPGADPAVLADHFGKTLQNGLSGILAKPPPHLRFVAVDEEA